LPYEGEFAHYRPLQRVAQSETVRSLLARQRVRGEGSHKEWESISEPAVQPASPNLDWLLAIDGSHQPVPVRNGFPGAEIGYVTVASVLVDMKRTRELETNRPTDPVEFRKTERAESLDCALPGSNIVLDDLSSPVASLRRGVFEVFEGTRMSPDGESLLDTYETLLAYKPTDAREQRCPYSDCPEEAAFVRGCGAYKCGCFGKRPLYSTDALRIHEGMQAASSNGAMFAEIMQVLERVWLIHILRTLERKGWLSTLRRMAIFLDGPLAVFGHPAWLSQAIGNELRRINDVFKASTDQDMLLLGVEKTGMFVEHLALLDKYPNGSPNRIPPQTPVLLTDVYIKENILFSGGGKPYGVDTYFGRKFLYKTKRSALIVATLPFLRLDDRDTSKAELVQFPRLAEALGLLDQVASSRFPNSISPLILANAEAAIPLHLGQRVLEELARQLVTQDN
jgi:NurA domain